MTVENASGKLALIKHIESYENNPLVIGSLKRQSSLVGEVEDFYGIETWNAFIKAPLTPSYHVRKFEVRSQKPEKIGTVPDELIGIISPFSEVKLEPSKLEYGRVRDDYWTGKSEGNPAGNHAVLGLLSGLAGAGISEYYGIPSLVSGVILVAGTLGGMLWAENTPSNMDGSLYQFLDLHEGARKADTFIRSDYLPYFVEKSVLR